MAESTALLPLLQHHLPYNKARLRCVAAFILALIKVRSVNLAQVALTLNSSAKTASNFRRLQRFLALFTLKQQHIARLVLTMLPQKNDLTLALTAPTGSSDAPTSTSSCWPSAIAAWLFRYSGACWGKQAIPTPTSASRSLIACLSFARRADQAC